MKYLVMTTLIVVVLTMANANGQESGFAIVAQPDMKEAGYAIVVHPDLKEVAINKSELKSVFLGRKRQWSDGSRIVLALYSDQVTFEAFSRRILSKTMRQYIMYWRRMIMTGRGSMPKQFKTADATLSFVKKTPGAIAIIPISGDLTGVKELEFK